MFGKKAKEILELKTKLYTAELSAKWWQEMAEVEKRSTDTVLEDNYRLRDELWELKSKLEKGEK